MAESLKVRTTGSDSPDDNEERVCPLCLKSEAKYTCPRCNSPYCSVVCYRSEKHLKCSESFYKDCFMEGLKDCNADPSEKQKVIEMLKRVEADTDYDDIDLTDDLHERLGDLDLDRDIDKVWDRLTDQEKREFQVMSSDGRLGNLVEVWTPWWNNSQLPLVTEVDGATAAREPKIASEIPNISDILRSKPSAEVKFNVINILYTYVFVSRLHNGDQVAMATESVQDFLEVSDVMGHNYSCGSVEESIQLCLGKLANPKNSFESTTEWNLSMIKDVEHIISSETTTTDPLHSVMCALSDVLIMFKTAYKNASKSIKNGVLDSKKKLEKKKLFQCVKKCEFTLSWCQTYGMALAGLVPELQMVYALLASEYQSLKLSKHRLESEWGGQIKPTKKTLIQEI